MSPEAQNRLAELARLIDRHAEEQTYYRLDDPGVIGALELPEGCFIEVHADEIPGGQPVPVAIWVNEEVLGGGWTFSEALQEARATLARDGAPE